MSFFKLSMGLQQLSHTWTPAALEPNLKVWNGSVWRAVESFYHASTLKLVDTLPEQAILEEVLERSKPPCPLGSEGLHPLLFTPFRYSSYPLGSRFRPANDLTGVFYASEHSETSMAEMAFHRHLFYAESPDMALPANPVEHTAFRVDVQCLAMLDLTSDPFIEFESDWTNPEDFTACHALVTAARGCGADAIRYKSVRDPLSRANIALLGIGPFSKRGGCGWSEPNGWQTWKVFMRPSVVQIVSEMPPIRREFPRALFAKHPFISAA